MSTAVYQRLPVLSDYASAKRHYDVVKPIRGTTIKPLGERRAHSYLFIEMRGEDVVLMHGRVPMITFHKPQQGDLPSQTRVTIVTQNPTHTEPTKPSACDGYFIQEVLYHYVKRAGVRKGVLMMVDQTDVKHLLPASEKRMFILNKDSRAITKADDSTNSLTGLTIDRQASNVVRKRYGEFYRYMKGMIGVRKQQYTTEDTWTGRAVVRTAIHTTFAELASVVPTVEVKEGANATAYSMFNHEKILPHPTQKPPMVVVRFDFTSGVGRNVRSEEPYQNWLANTKAFLNLVSAPADDPDQHDKFRQAFVWLLFYCSTGNLWRFDAANKAAPLEVNAYDVQARMDEIIFKYHSDEVFKTVQLKPGVIPSTRYNGWVTRQEGGPWY